MMEINIGSLEFYNEIEIGDLQLDVKNVYPELEKVTVQSRVEEQIVKPTKYGFSEITVKPIEINLEDKTVTPTKDNQEVTASDGYDGLSKVTIEKIPDEYIIPAGSIEITTNGIHDVVDKASAIVNVPEKQLGIKTITANGTYKATDDNLDGYSEVEVETSGVDINDYWNSSVPAINGLRGCSYIKKIPYIDTSNVTFFNSFFAACANITTIPNINTEKAIGMSFMFNSCHSLQQIPYLNTSKVTNMSNMFQLCNALVQTPDLDTSNVTDMSYMFQGCKALSTSTLSNTPKVTNIQSIFSGCTSLKNVNKIDVSNSIYFRDCFYGCSALENFGGFENAGKGFSKSASASYSYYTIKLSSCTKLTYESLMNVINNLYDIKTAGINTQQLILGDTNLAKLTAEEIAIATEKGWTVS